MRFDPTHAPVRARRAAFVTIAALMIGAGCGERAPVIRTSGATMPNPSGCYVLVYEGQQFSGAREFINGPQKYTTLTNLPFRADWRHRIHSVQAGPVASVTLWSEEQLKGMSERVDPGALHPFLLDALNGKVQSLEITCTPP